MLFSVYVSEAVELAKGKFAIDCFECEEGDGDKESEVRTVFISCSNIINFSHHPVFPCFAVHYMNLCISYRLT